MGWPKTTENKRIKEQEYYCFYYFPRSLVLLLSIVSGKLCLFTPTVPIKTKTLFFLLFSSENCFSVTCAAISPGIIAQILA